MILVAVYAAIGVGFAIYWVRSVNTRRSWHYSRRDYCDESPCADCVTAAIHGGMFWPMMLPVYCAEMMRLRNQGEEIGGERDYEDVVRMISDEAP